MIKKLLICPYFGEFPEWMPEFRKQIPHMKAMGYDFLIDTNLRGFKKRVKGMLGIDAPIISGEGKVWDYRAVLGFIYRNKLRGYDWYGHCDFDVVFGDVNKFFSDKLLEQNDIISNHSTYVAGFFSLYRNTPKVNTLFKNVQYEPFLLGPPNGWVEKEYTQAVVRSGVRYKFMSEQGDYTDTKPNLKSEDGKLYQDGKEIAMFHFRRSKRWPLKEESWPIKS